MSLAQKMPFLQDVFQMTTIALVSVINHHINELSLFWDTLYKEYRKYGTKWLEVGIKSKV